MRKYGIEIRNGKCENTKKIGICFFKLETISPRCRSMRMKSEMGIVKILKKISSIYWKQYHSNAEL